MTEIAQLKEELRRKQSPSRKAGPSLRLFKPVTERKTAGCYVHVVEDIPDDLTAYVGHYLIFDENDEARLVLVDSVGNLSRCDLNDNRPLLQRLNQALEGQAGKVWLSGDEVEDLIASRRVSHDIEYGY